MAKTKPQKIQNVYKDKINIKDLLYKIITLKI